MDFLKKQNWGMVISLLLWCTVTLIRVLHHSPWYDEAHAWLISQELNIFEIIKLMKIEGHTFIWYLLLMPFAKTNFMYPYSMLLLNWLFCFIAVLILWLKAPFNNWIKFLISFSFPFLAMYPVVARCYSIGIMFLFAIAAQEKSKLAHPNWYALLLILCANTSVMAAVGAMTFGILYIKDIFVQKRKLSEYMLSFLILIFGAGIILFQLLGTSKDIIFVPMPMSVNFFKYLIVNNFVINISALLTCSILIFIFYMKNRKIPFFLVLSYSTLFLVNCVYAGRIWHHFFYYIYFIISCWLIREKYENLKFDKILSVILLVLSLIFIFYSPGSNYYACIINSPSRKFAHTILEDSKIRKSTLILYNNLILYEIVPYLKNSDISIINYCSGKSFNYDNISFYKGIDCKYEGYMQVDFNGKHFEKLMSKNELNYFIGPSTLVERMPMYINSQKALKFNFYKKLNDDLYLYLLNYIYTNNS